mmetsp:Transcript_39574/g.51031  ORF Transcript_39574/g.51031 Transcript_39574/m.51031 type:complete len:390 (-) Transcript_39574:578-1747(-)
MDKPPQIVDSDKDLTSGHSLSRTHDIVPLDPSFEDLNQHKRKRTLSREESADDHQSHPRHHHHHHHHHHHGDGHKHAKHNITDIPVLEYNADGEADTILSLPLRQNSKGFDDEDPGRERDGNESSSSSDSDDDCPPMPPPLEKRSFSFVASFSNELQHLSADIKSIKEDMATDDADDTHVRREEEQEVLRLQTEAIHKAEFKCFLHVIINCMGFLFIEHEAFQLFYRDHIWTCLFGDNSTTTGCLKQTIVDTCKSDVCTIDHSYWEHLQCHVCYEASKYFAIVVFGLFLLFAVWATESWFPHTKKFKKICLSVFEECAHGKDVLEEAALHSSVLLLYDQINTSIPRHVTPPTHDEVAQLLEIFDDNHDGVMDRGEFIDFSEFLFYQVHV